MRVKVYITSQDTYLVLPIDGSRASIPADVLAAFGELYFLRNSDLTSKDAKIAESIAEKGYSIYEPEVSVG